MAKDEKKPQPTHQPLAPLTPQERGLENIPKMSAEDLALMAGGMDSSDISVPRLVILQSLSPEVTTERSGVPGDFFLKGLNLNLGPGPIEIIPFMRSKSRIRWKAMDQGGGQLCSSPDGIQGHGDPGGNCETCPKKDWIHKDARTGKLKPDCDIYENIICTIRTMTDWIPVAFSGTRTRLKPIKELNNLLLLEINKRRPLFAKCYSVRGIQKSTGQIVYHNFAISPGNGNQLLPPAEIEKGFAFFQAIKGKKLVVSQEAEEVGMEAPAAHEGPSI